jgi:hypothetical protein
MRRILPWIWHRTSTDESDEAAPLHSLSLACSRSLALSYFCVHARVWSFCAAFLPDKSFLTLQTPTPQKRKRRRRKKVARRRKSEWVHAVVGSGSRATRQQRRGEAYATLLTLSNTLSCRIRKQYLHVHTPYCVRSSKSWSLRTKPASEIKNCIFKKDQADRQRNK